MKKEDKIRRVNKYFENITYNEKLTYKEVRELSIRMLNSKNNEDKLYIRNRIIMGSMYKIHSFLRNALVEDLENNFVSLEDIIEDFIIQYIEFIEKGLLITFPHFTYIFCNILYVKLNAKNKFIKVTNELLKEYFNDLVCWYLNEKKLSGTVSFNKFIEYCKSKVVNINNYDIFEAYTILNNFIISFEKENMSDSYINSYIYKFKNVMLNNSLIDFYECNSDEDKSIDVIDEIDNRIISEKFREILSLNLKKSQINVINEIFYNGKSVEELAKENNVCRSAIYQILKSMTVRIMKKKSKDMKRIRLDYNGEKSRY